MCAFVVEPQKCIADTKTKPKNHLHIGVNTKFLKYELPLSESHFYAFTFFVTLQTFSSVSNRSSAVRRMYVVDVSCRNTGVKALEV